MLVAQKCKMMLQRFKESTIKSTLGRGEDLKKLKDKLDQYHKVIISGQLGSGKSHFIKYCLGIWNLHEKTFYIIS